MRQVQPGLLVPLGRLALPALMGQLAQLGPRVHRENPVLQASRVRLEMLVQLVRPDPMALMERRDRKEK